jgi:multidrug transporter EmrE-like cation transporter
MPGWIAVAAVVVLTVYGQLIVKWQVGEAGAFPASSDERARFLLRLLANPWVISALLGGALAAVAWMAALTRYDLSTAYPFMSTTFVLVLIGSVIFFDESFTVPKVAGLVLIMAGLVVGSQE